MVKEESVMSLIRKIDQRVKAGIDARFKEHDLTFSQSQILHFLSNNGGSASQKQLQEYMKVSHPTIVGLVKRLESHSFVTTKVDEKDKRNKIVTATEEAAKFKQELIDTIQHTDEVMYRNVTEEEMQQLKELLSKINSNLEEGRRERND